MSTKLNPNITIKELEHQVDDICQQGIEHIDALDAVNVLLGNDVDPKHPKTETRSVPCSDLHELTAIDLVRVIGSVDIPLGSGVVTLKDLGEYLEQRTRELKETLNYMESALLDRLRVHRHQYRTWLYGAIDKADCMNKTKALNDAMDAFEDR